MGGALHKPADAVKLDFDSRRIRAAFASVAFRFRMEFHWRESRKELNFLASPNGIHGRKRLKSTRQEKGVFAFDPVMRSRLGCASQKIWKVMFASIRRHQHWIWYVVVVVVIISFVIFFSPVQRFSTGGGSMDLGSIDGRTITLDEFRDARAEAELYHLIRFGDWPKGDESRQFGFDLERETYNRLLIVARMKELNIDPSQDSTVAWVRDVFKDTKTQHFDVRTFENFLKENIVRHNISEDQFWKFAKHQVGLQHLIAVMGITGKLVPPSETERLYRQKNEPSVVEMAVFNVSNYLASVSVTPEALGQYYTNNMPEYRLPIRVQVNYVKFASSNYTAQALEQLNKMTNLNQALDETYERQGAAFFKDSQGNPLPKDLAKSRLKQDEVDRIAHNLARRKANDFLTQLMDESDKSKSPEILNQLAQKFQVPVGTTAPFDEQSGPRELDVPATFGRSAFALSAEQPYGSAAIAAEDGFYVLYFKQRFPSEQQSFEKVKDRVEADFKRTEARKLAQQAGEKFAASVTNALAAGKTFEQASQEANVTAVTLPPFSQSTRTLQDPGLDRYLGLLQNFVPNLAPGKTTPFVPLRDGGAVLFLKSREPINEEKLKSELPAFTAQIRDQETYSAFGEWLQHEITKSINMPKSTRAAAR
jgi:hypothetical protein